MSSFFFFLEIIEPVSFLSQKDGQKFKIKWIFELNVWSILNKDLISKSVSVTAARIMNVGYLKVMHRLHLHLFFFFFSLRQIADVFS